MTYVVNAVDLFCGVGGLTYGVQSAGINVVAGYDIDQRSKFAYEHNNNAQFILKDVKDIDEMEINSLYPKNTQVLILISGLFMRLIMVSHKEENDYYY